jgi:hypothetical protein
LRYCRLQARRWQSWLRAAPLNGSGTRITVAPLPTPESRTARRYARLPQCFVTHSHARPQSRCQWGRARVPRIQEFGGSACAPCAENEPWNLDATPHRRRSYHALPRPLQAIARADFVCAIIPYRIGGARKAHLLPRGAQIRARGRGIQSPSCDSGPRWALNLREELPAAVRGRVHRAVEWTPVSVRARLGPRALRAHAFLTRSALGNNLAGRCPRLPQPAQQTSWTLPLLKRPRRLQLPDRREWALVIAHGPCARARRRH